MKIYKRIFQTISLLFLTSILLISCKTQELSSKVYPYSHDEFKFPESNLLKDKQNIGIAFSGGGSRSASLTAGQLRALNQIDFLDKVKYISSVSGGSWASISYTFSNLSNNELLGTYISPNKLTLKSLKNDANGKIIESVSNSYVYDKYFKNALKLKGDEIYSKILNEIYLEPLNLGKNKYVSYNTTSVSSILEKSPNKKNLTSDDFYKVNKKTNRPFLIVNGTVIGKLWNSWKLSSMHLEMTPLYTGVSYYNEDYKRKIGGGYVETFAFDNKFKRTENEQLILKKRKNRFTLSDMMAITGNAPGTYAYRKWWAKILQGKNLGLPEIQFFSIPEALDKKKIKNREFPIGDGGNLENLGLIPLLKRKVKKIIVFANSKYPIQEITTKQGVKKAKIDNAIDRAFGIHVNTPFSISTNLLSNINNEYQVLADSLFKRKKEGKPLIYTSTYIINKNPDYGIFPTKENNSVEITWVYNDGFEGQYVDKLLPEVKSFYYNKGFDTGKSAFPHLPTFKTSKWFRAIDYETEWANMLAHFSSWVIIDNESEFTKILD